MTTEKYFQNKQNEKLIKQINERVSQARSEGRIAFYEYLKLVEQATKRKFEKA